MKKKYIIFTVVLVFVILLIPRINVLKDGGSVEYQALTYKITKLKRLDSNYVNNTKSGVIIEIFGKEVYQKITSKKKSTSGTYFIDKEISLETGHTKVFKDGLFVIKKNEKIGFMNKKGEIVIEPMYDDAFPFVDGVSRVLLFPENPSIYNSGRHGYIDVNNNLVSEIKYGYANDFSEGYGLVCLGEVESFQEPCRDSVLIDRNGNVLIDSTKRDFVLVGDVHDGLILAIKDGKYGFVDVYGNIIIDFQYKTSSYFNYGYAVVMTFNDKLVVIDKHGEIILDLSKYSNAYFLDKDLIIVEENHKQGVINLLGETLIELKYNYISSTYDNYFLVSIDPETFKLLNKKGKEVLDLSDYDTAGRISDGLISVRKNKKWGLIDIGGNIVINIEYDRVGEFSDGLMYAVKAGKEMFLDREGNVVLTYKD